MKDQCSINLSGFEREVILPYTYFQRRIYDIHDMQLYHKSVNKGIEIWSSLGLLLAADSQKWASV